MDGKRNTIRFSKSYRKLPPEANGKIAILLVAQPVMLENQTKHFLDYDTLAKDGTRYELPAKGQYIVLGFSCAGTFFTTIRRFTPEKWKYYEGSVQKEFLIEIKESV